MSAVGSTSNNPSHARNYAQCTSCREHLQQKARFARADLPRRIEGIEGICRACRCTKGQRGSCTHITGLSNRYFEVPSYVNPTLKMISFIHNDCCRVPW
jgi:hypothetical protein